MFALANDEHPAGGVAHDVLGDASEDPLERRWPGNRGRGNLSTRTRQCTGR
jgi:hypothetical protein